MKDIFLDKTMEGTCMNHIVGYLLCVNLTYTYIANKKY